jgi:chaperonin GroEL (HSP60 family)
MNKILVKVFYTNVGINMEEQLNPFFQENKLTPRDIVGVKILPTQVGCVITLRYRANTHHLAIHGCTATALCKGNCNEFERSLEDVLNSVKDLVAEDSMIWGTGTYVWLGISEKKG